ncbi:MAG: Crp/Fnr family transcriptional regulator [Chryseolinea sp.]
MELTTYYFINNSLFEHLRKDEVAFLNQNMTQEKYAKGKNVFQEGSYPKGVFILDKGKVKIYQSFDDGQQIMSVHVQGEIFGYRSFLCGETYPVTATTIEECRISFIPKGPFLELLQRSTLLSNILLRFLSYEFTVWVNTISNLTQRTARERLLLSLLILIEKYKTKKLWPVEIRLSRADMAALVGTSKETLSRMMTQLKQEKYIASKGRSIIINGPAQVARLKKALSDSSKPGLT